MDTKLTINTRKKQLQPLYTKFGPITPPGSRLRSEKPPALPILARVRYFYGHFEDPMSDIIGHGYEKHFEHMREAVTTRSTPSLTP